MCASSARATPDLSGDELANDLVATARVGALGREDGGGPDVVVSRRLDVGAVRNERPGGAAAAAAAAA